MLRSTHLTTICLILATTSCSTQEGDGSGTTPTPETTFAKLQVQGITCGVQTDVASFSDVDEAKFIQLVKSNMTDDRLKEAIDARQTDCVAADSAQTPATATNDRPIEMSRHAITGTYVVEQIEKVSSPSVGWSPVSIYRDGAAYGNMCGNDAIKDYIAEFQGVSSAYTSPGGLRIMGLNSWGDCYLKNPTGARVYSDNSIRACYGYWSVIYCGGAQTYDTRIYRAY